MKKFSIVTWISLIVLVFYIIMLIASTIYGMYGGVNGFEWILAILYVSSIVIIPYYIIVFIISLICDRKVKKRIILKNIIIIILILIPIILYSTKFIFIK